MQWECVAREQEDCGRRLIGAGKRATWRASGSGQGYDEGANDDGKKTWFNPFGSVPDKR